jgi:hydroxymethylbilane synthase
VGARGSPLAVAQANWVIHSLKAKNANLKIKLETITTSGDDLSVDLASGERPKGLFVKEIETALLDGRVDVAVHSSKDTPFDTPKGLVISVWPERGPVGDLLCVPGPGPADLRSLPKGARVGTSSVRRKGFLLHRRPDLVVTPLRGNMATRLAKTAEGLDATLIAEAAFHRLPDLPLVGHWLIPRTILLPAPGQGALALETRAEDDHVQNVIGPLSHLPTTYAMLCERSFCRRLDSGCHVPLAAYSFMPTERRLTLMTALAHPEGRSMVKLTVHGPVRNHYDAINLGVEGAELLITRIHTQAPELLAFLPPKALKK